jgi:hypothetical protein
VWGCCDTVAPGGDVRRVLNTVISKGPNTTGVSFLSPEDGNTPSCRNVLFSSYLEFRAMDKVHKSSDSEIIGLFVSA